VTPRDPEVLVVGAGPSGLACAIACRQAGLDGEVVEKGVLVNSIFHFPAGMTFFTTPELLEIGGLPFVTPYEKPTRHEALRYYRRVADAHGLRVTLGEEVVALPPPQDGRFVVRTRSADGTGRIRRVPYVVLATGYYDWPNRLGVPGEDLPHVTHYYTDAHVHYRQRVLVVGAKNSAAIAALDLFRTGARVTLVHRGDDLSRSIKYWIRPDIENRIKEGSIDARFRTRVVEIRRQSAVLEGPGGAREELPVDAVLLMTGYHPDATLLRQAGVTVDDATLKPQIDPGSLETNVAGLFVAGALAAGNETSRIFIENGRFHGEAIAAAIRERRESG
jgi:thioredoxin reductase (NADPH)